MFRRLFKFITETGPYTYGATRTDRNIGSNNQAFGRPYMPVESGQYGPRYNVRGNLDSYASAGLVIAQSLPSVSLRANGVYFAGAFGTTALSGDGPGNN